jgi:hypothetical protein
MATLCVTLSLTLLALGSADPVGGFCLGTLSFGRPTTIVGPVLDTISISCDVIADTMCEVLGSRVNMGLLGLVRTPCSTSSVVIL